MTRTTADFLIAFIALAAGVAIVVTLPLEVPGAGLASLQDMTSAAFFPMLAAILIAFSGLILGIKTFIHRAADPEAKVDPTGFRPLLMLGAFVVYVPLIHVLGMFAASVLAIIALPFVYGFRDARWIGPIAILIPFGVYLLFEKVLKVLFPHGAIF